LIAQNGKKEPARVGEDAFLDRLDPAAIHADRDVVFTLACDRAGVATDAFFQVDDKAVVGHRGEY
jgi:hypothetical protein